MGPHKLREQIIQTGMTREVVLLCTNCTRVWKKGSNPPKDCQMDGLDLMKLSKSRMKELGEYESRQRQLRD